MVKVFVILGGLGVEGVSTIALSYLEAIDKSNLDIALIVAGPSDITMMNKAQAIGIQIIELPYRKQNPREYYRKLFYLLKQEKPNVVHIHGNSATMALDLLVAKLAGVPIRLPHCHNTKCDNERINILLRPLLYCTMTEGLACGEDAGKWLYKNRKFKIIKNGRKIENFLFDEKLRNAYRSKLNIENTTVAVGHVGTFTEQKNQKFLIEVWQKIKNENIRLYLFGDGPLREQCNKLVKENGLEKQIVFMGNVSNIGCYLNAMDIMVLPSKYEGLPLVTLEWQINGLPCIISDCVTKECKIMNNVIFEDISQENIKEWANIIETGQLKRKEKIDNSEIYRRITNAGFNIVENAKWLSYEYDRLYRENIRRRL